MPRTHQHSADVQHASLGRALADALHRAHQHHEWPRIHEEIADLATHAMPSSVPPPSAHPIVRDLQERSDALLHALGPCHASMRSMRRFGIVRNGSAIPDELGYPFIKPIAPGRENIVCCRLLDEREWRLVPVKEWRVRVEIGEGSHETTTVALMAPDMEEVSRDTFRAWFGYSLSQLYKMTLSPGFPGLRRDRRGSIRVRLAQYLPYYLLDRASDAA